MEIGIILSIVGTFGTFALIVNGYFLRGIFQDLNAVKVKLAEMSARSEDKTKRIEDLETNQREIFDRLNLVEREVLK